MADPEPQRLGVPQPTPLTATSMATQKEAAVRLSLMRQYHRRKPCDGLLSILVAVFAAPTLAWVFDLDWKIWAWATALMLTNAPIFVEKILFERAVPPSAQAHELAPGVLDRWAAIGTIQTALSGLAWGVGLSVAAFDAKPELQVAALTTLALVAAVVTVSLADNLASSRSFLLGELLPPVAAVLLLPHPDLWVVAVAMTASLVVLLKLAGDSHTAVRQLLYAQEALRDITQGALAARDEAQRASAVKTRFLANMSHEIRTPMNGVLGMLQLLRATPLSSQQSDYTDKSEASARTLMALLNDFLDVSKIEAGQLTLEKHPVNLNQLMREVHAVLLGLAAGKDVVVELLVKGSAPSPGKSCDTPPTNLWVLADPLRLQQVLLNLGGNAVKFSASGQVTIELTLLAQLSDAVRLRFQVQDNGIGIAAAQLPHIFESFTQAETSTARRFGGSGLGLSIAQQLVAQMGGDIGVVSAPGSGSLFSFELTLQTTPAPQEVLQKTPIAQVGVAGQRLLGAKVLLVEDQFINQQIAREMLKKEGATVTVAEDGALALLAFEKSLSSTAFDAVLMDIQMPNMDGYEATQRMRAMEQARGLQRVPVIAMSANALLSDPQMGLAAGMDDHVGKPFRIEAVVALLTQHIARNRSKESAKT